MHKTFDISLADAIDKLSLNKEEIQELGRLTARREVANAKVGRNVLYREATLRRIFNR